MRDASRLPYSAVGKLFVRYGYGHGVECTATAIDTPSRSLVLTAAHCLKVWDCLEGCRPTVARSETFIPAYDHGRAPFGRFAGESLGSTRRLAGSRGEQL